MLNLAAAPVIMKQLLKFSIQFGSHFIYFKIAECRKNYNENKLKLTSAKGQLTKSLNKFEESCKALSKDLVKDELPQSSKVRMAAVVMEKLSILSEKREDVRKSR